MQEFDIYDKFTPTAKDGVNFQSDEMIKIPLVYHQ